MCDTYPNLEQWTKFCPPPPPPHTHTNLRCIDFLICAGKSTYGRFIVLVVPHSALDLAAVCDCGISWLCSLTFSKRNLIKGHLLKSNVRSDICFAIMHTLHGLYQMFKWVSKLHYQYHWSRGNILDLKLHVYSLSKNGFENNKGRLIRTLYRGNSFQSDFYRKPILSPPVSNPGLTQPGSQFLNSFVWPQTAKSKQS